MDRAATREPDRKRFVVGIPKGHHLAFAGLQNTECFGYDRALDAAA